MRKKILKFNIFIHVLNSNYVFTCGLINPIYLRFIKKSIPSFSSNVIDKVGCPIQETAGGLFS
jgi:hypothetical protein